MIHRIPKLSNSHSFFLFSARGVGKSSLVEKHFKSEKKSRMGDHRRSAKNS